MEAVFCSVCPLSPYDIGPSFASFRLKLVRWGIGLILKSICKLLRIGRWSEPRFVFVCQLVELIGEANANEPSVEDGLALPGSLVAESQCRIPKLEPDIIFSNMVPLVYVELEYHAEWCALKSHSIRVLSSDGPGKEGNLLRKSLLEVCKRW